MVQTPQGQMVVQGGQPQPPAAMPQMVMQPVSDLIQKIWWISYY